MQEERRQLRQLAKAANTNEIVEEILSQREEAASRLVPFPAPATEHDSEGLRAAQEAVQALRPEMPEILTAEELAAGQAALERIEIPVATIIRDDDYFCDLWKQIRAGERVPEAELDWMRFYLGTKEGRGVLLFLGLQESDISPYLQSPDRPDRIAM